MNQPYKLQIHGYENPGMLAKSRELGNSGVYFPDMTLLVEHNESVLKDGVGLLVWSGTGNYPFEAQKFCRIILTPENATKLGKKLQELGELVSDRQSFQESVKNPEICSIEDV